MIIYYLLFSEIEEIILRLLSPVAQKPGQVFVGIVHWFEMLFR